MGNILSFFDLTSYIHKRYYRSKYRKEYYKQFITEEDAPSLLQLLQQQGAVQTTPQPIRYNEIAFGSGISQLRKKLGSPRYTFSIPMHTAEHKALIFVKNINRHHVIINCHFLDGQLFLVHNHLEEPLQDLGAFLKAEMERKYSCALDQKENLLVDENGNQLFFSTVPDIHSYMSAGDQTFREKLQNEILYNQAKSLQQSQHHFERIARSLA